MIEKVQFIRFTTAKCKESVNTINNKLALGLRLGTVWVRVRVRSDRVQVSLNVSIRCINGHGRERGGCAEKVDSPKETVRCSYPRRSMWAERERREKPSALQL